VAGTLLLARADRARVWRTYEVGKSCAVAAAILLPWMAMLVAVHGWAFFYEFFVVHNLGRYAGGLSNSQSGSVFYYLLVLMVGFFPWVMVLPVALPAALTRWRRNLASPDAVQALPALAAVWAVFYVVFFSL